MKIDIEQVYDLIKEARRQSVYGDEHSADRYYFNCGVRTMAASIDAAIRLLEMKGGETDEEGR